MMIFWLTCLVGYPRTSAPEPYNSVSSKTIRFDQSFGFSFNNGKVKGFLPSEFKIENIDAFGAALYRGQWRGVRFVKTR